jgi:hypothetical protein
MEEPMVAWSKILQDDFAAVAFAEANEPEAALSLMPDREPPRNRALTETLRNVFAGVAFAEAGLSDEALVIANGRSRRAMPSRHTSFIDAIGLGGVQFRYGVAYV